MEDKYVAIIVVILGLGWLSALTFSDYYKHQEKIAHCEPGK